MLVLGFVSGAIGWVGAHMLFPPSYDAVVELRLSHEELSTLLASADERPDDERGAADVSLHGKQSFFIRPGTECMTIVSVVTCSNVVGVRAAMPELAQALLAGLLGRIEARYSVDGVMSRAAEAAKNEVDIHEQSLRSLRRVVAQLRSEADAEPSSPGNLDLADYADAILVLERGINDAEQTALAARLRAQIYQQDILVREPGPPLRVGIRPELVGAVAAMESILLHLNVSLLRLYLLRQNPQSNVRLKLRLIREMLGRTKHD
jgi:hypothetical protein